MKKPEVAIENFEKVYDFYATHQANRTGALLAHTLADFIYRPNITYAEGAERELQSTISSGGSLVIAFNHLTYKDHFPMAAVAWQTPLRTQIGRARALAKDELFRTPIRPMLDMVGGIPAFRAKNYVNEDQVHRVTDRLVEVASDRLVNGEHIAGAPEGTCSVEHPQVLQPLHSGLGRIAVRGQEKGANVSIVTVGLSYGENLRGTKDTSVRHASVFMSSPITDLPKTPDKVTEVIRQSLQCSVDQASIAVPIVAKRSAS